MNNLVISYDLKTPGQSYDRVIEAIKSLGSWAKVHYSLWYVKTNHTANSAAEIVRKATDANDTLFVVDATNNNAAWYNLDPKVSEFIREQWNTSAARRHY